ncbi:glutathione S-transferase family protein [Mesorhizobium xinjiangense]|uniref:glutathione S-transferase family protein n=1 Tax=Mesorhizobium xinjiangense TaxID=2678685 RepID=UPI0012EE10CD|nr:glutathione S-transferase family protein [Mesorhizobium xinjiangense]
MTGKPRLFGADYSVYVRIARLALLEKGVDHECIPVDIFSKDGVPDWYQERHPFKRIPAFEHGSLKLFETSAITRYVDEAYDGPLLQPPDAFGRAVMNQIVSLLDAYAYRAMVWGVYVERVSKPRENNTPDERLIAASLETARTCLSVLDRQLADKSWLIGDALTLADLYAASMLAYFVKAPEGAALVADYPAVARWWHAVQARTSFQASEPTS